MVTLDILAPSLAIDHAVPQMRQTCFVYLESSPDSKGRTTEAKKLES
jgi:hypothetical protein